MPSRICSFVAKLAFVIILSGVNAHGAENTGKDACQGNESSLQGTTWQSESSKMIFKACQLTIVKANGCEIIGNYKTKFYESTGRTVISFTIISSCSPSAVVNNMINDNALVGGVHNIAVTISGASMSLYGFGEDIADTLIKQ